MKILRKRFFIYNNEFYSLITLRKIKEFQVIYEDKTLLQWEMVSGIYCHGFNATAFRFNGEIFHLYLIQD